MKIRVPLFIDESLSMEENLQNQKEYELRLYNQIQELWHKRRIEFFDRMLFRCRQHLFEKLRDASFYVTNTDVESVLIYEVMDGNYDVYPFQQNNYYGEFRWLINQGIEYLRSDEFLNYHKQQSQLSLLL